METKTLTWYSYKVFAYVLFIIILFPGSASSSLLHPWALNSSIEHQNYTAISPFRLLNRRFLSQCPDSNPYLQINVSKSSDLSDDEFVTITVSGVLLPAESDWVAMISPSDSNLETCLSAEAMYVQTGDVSSLPLLCHYPVKAKLMSNDRDYLSCKKKECKKYSNGKCVVTTCSGSIKFHVINIRTDIEFVFFAGGFDTPCILNRTNPINFANPKSPLYGHLSSSDSTATSMRVTWVSGDKEPQQVQYGDGKSETSKVTTFTQDDMCNATALQSPAKDFGWHDPGYIHTAVMTGLRPSATFSYRYGSDLVGWSDKIQFKTPPAGGSSEVLRFLTYGDMGKAPLDDSAEHYIQPGSLSVIKAMADEVDNGSVDSIFHIGDISYATGFLVEWDFFLHQISPVASRVSYMTAIGNHERDYLGSSGSVYESPDSGGECGVAYETYFPMPIPARDKPWYSIEQAGVHFTVMSTEHDWSENSEQYEWMKKDMASVDRSKTPWLIFSGHRPMYSSLSSSVDNKFVDAVEPLLLDNKVDLALFGHVHNYERTCSVYKQSCLAMPTKDANGIDTYDHSNYSAPVQAVIGMAGFTLDKFPDNADHTWSLIRISKFGYLRGNTNKEEMKFEFVNSDTREVEDSFRIIKAK
ncbi:probable inactive purple acid phosphatase 1 [Citrus clementina]|uniref:probable inactive purple acid phosphatase 1 n=2 Tax=Citrus TaxID=2706 RepID=UPI000CED2189|nr:probable inactive purple acid phosphatase 1 [Citrus x clementina]